MSDLSQRLSSFFPLLISVVLALILTALILVTLDKNPWMAYRALLDGAFTNQNSFAETLVKATPILFVAIGITIAFKTSVINIGGEGQMIVGALAGTSLTLALSDTLGSGVIPLALLGAFLAGGLYAGLAGFLKAYYGVNEILSTIMLNQVAVQLMNYLLNGLLLDPESVGVNNIPKTARIAELAELPRLVLPFPNILLFDRTRLHWGLVLAVVLAVVLYVVIFHTTLGFRIRTVGQNERAARYAGMNVERTIVLSMFLAGGFAGLAGIVQVLGLQYRLQTDGSPGGFTGGAGFNGIVAALFGGLNPLGAIPASVLFGGLLVGAQKMQREIGVTASLITIMNGMIVVFVVSSQFFVHTIQQRLRLQALRKMTEKAE